MNNNTKKPPFTPGDRICGYIRDSGGDEQDKSVQQQLSIIQDWSRENGYILTNIFVDEAKPGSSTIGRDKFLEMINHFRQTGCQEVGIVFWSFSRFARSYNDSQFYKADLRRRGFILHSLTDNIPDGLSGQLFEAIIEWKDAVFLEDLSRDVKRGLHDLVLTHRAVPGTPPRGFTRVPIEIGKRRDGSPRVVHRWQPDPETVPLVRLAFQMRLEGHSLAEINRATRLYNSLNSYTTFFANPIYKGELRFGPHIIPDYCPPVVEPELWEAVQVIVDRHANHRNLKHNSPDHPRRVASSYILSGLVYCARCGSPHYGLSARQRSGDYYRRYACTRAHRARSTENACDAKPVPADVLEAAVLDELRSRILQPEHLDELRQAVIAGQQRRQSQLDHHRRSLEKDLRLVHRKVANITAAIAEAGHSRSLLSALATLESEEAEIRAELSRISASPENLHAVEDFDHPTLAEQLRASLESHDPAELRQILRGLLQRVLVDRDGPVITGQISYYYPPPRAHPKA